MSCTSSEPPVTFRFLGTTWALWMSARKKKIPYRKSGIHPRTGNRGRVNLTLSPETEKVIRGYAEVIDMPYATAAASLLEEMAPQLNKFVISMRAVKDREAAVVDSFRDVLAATQQDLAQANFEFNEAVKESRKKKGRD